MSEQHPTPELGEGCKLDFDRTPVDVLRIEGATAPAQEPLVLLVRGSSTTSRKSMNPGRPLAWTDEADADGLTAFYGLQASASCGCARAGPPIR